MTGTRSDRGKFKWLTARRLTLLTSVGALGAAMLLVGPSGRYWQPSVGAGLASAAEFEMQRPVGFADIVAKVKPAVISVRVKVSGSAEPALDRDSDEQQSQCSPARRSTSFSSSAISLVSNSAGSPDLMRHGDMKPSPVKDLASSFRRTAMR